MALGFYQMQRIQVQLFDGGAEDGDEPILQGSLYEDDGVASRQLQDGRQDDRPAWV